MKTRIQLSEKEVELPRSQVEAIIKDYLERHDLAVVGPFGNMDSTRTFEVEVEKVK